MAHWPFIVFNRARQWERGCRAKASAMSCDAATATLKGRPDHDVAHRACVEAKTRQNVD